MSKTGKFNPDDVVKAFRNAARQSGLPELGATISGHTFGYRQTQTAEGTRKASQFGKYNSARRRSSRLKNNGIPSAVLHRRLTLWVFGLVVIALAAILGRFRDGWRLKRPKREPRPGDY